ncbi:MAG: hypothetical protein L0312_19005, partial [Acidobacteria bacterium]|nr:hypothetical protein [Acidobacteriota bacterium]
NFNFFTATLLGGVGRRARQVGLQASFLGFYGSGCGRPARAPRRQPCSAAVRSRNTLPGSLWLI